MESMEEEGEEEQSMIDEQKNYDGTQNDYMENGDGIEIDLNEDADEELQSDQQFDYIEPTRKEGN